MLDCLLLTSNIERVDSGYSAKLLGSSVKLARETRGLSLRQLDKLSGVSASELSRIEQGKRPGISVPHLIKISDALGARLEWLLYRRGTMFNDASESGLHPATTANGGAKGGARTPG